MPDDNWSCGSAAGQYNVRVCTANAEPIREYSMDAGVDQVSCIADIERSLYEKLCACPLEPMVAIITEETMGGFNQVQINLEPAAIS